MQESGLRNHPHLGDRNDHDSIGVLQQRPSQGWGTIDQLTRPAYQAGKFFDKLLTVPGWESIPLTQAAQAVQASAFGHSWKIVFYLHLFRRCVRHIASRRPTW